VNYLQRCRGGKSAVVAGRWPPNRDVRLLRAYDDAHKGESIAAIARRLRAQGTELGNTAEAIAKQIRVLIGARKKQDHRSRVESRRGRMATRNEPPTLLGGAFSREK
jgi:hypothetical protein